MRERLEALYLGHDERSLSAINRRFIDGICALLGIATRISSSRGYPADGRRTERVRRLCRRPARRVPLRPAARSYLDEELFRDAGIEVE